MNNASFILISPEMAQEIQRAFGITPEPSVLASLLIPLLGMMTTDLIIFGGARRYLTWSVVCLAYLATGSQSLLIMPFFLASLVLFMHTLTGGLRRLRRSDVVGLGLMALAALMLLLINGSILEALGRVSGQQDNRSAAMRFADVLIGLEMFREKPLFGYGLGSLGGVAEDVMGQLGLNLSSGGITSGLLRAMAEEGSAGIAALVVAAACMYPGRLPRRISIEAARLAGYQFTFVIGCVLAATLFVGYRNLYSLWMIVPIGLSLKMNLKTLRSQGSLEELPPIVTEQAIGGSYA